MIERYQQWEEDDNAHFIVLKVCTDISHSPFVVNFLRH